MLRDKLYQIISLHCSNDAVVIIEIYPDHEIFSGHFPGQPVLPGACILQILKEILTEITDTSVRLKRADQIKFLSLIDPQVNNVLEFKISWSRAEDQLLRVTASIIADKVVSVKFKGTFLVL